MKTNSKALLLLVLPLLALTACSKDETDIPPGETPGTGGNIRFEMEFTPQTRVETDANFNCAWEDNDRIGLFAVESGSPLNPSDNYIHNIALTYNKGADTWTPSKKLHWPDNSGKLDFYAYYPYNNNASNPTNITFNVLENQYSTSDFSKSYFMTAIPAKNVENGQTVRLQFAHALSMIQVKVINQTGTQIDTRFRASLKDVPVQVKANLQAETVSTQNAPAADISMNPFSGQAIFRALVPATGTVASILLFEQAGSPGIYHAYKDNITTTAGKATQLQITLKQ